ncbi:MAG: hypothetical protein Q9210_007127 [Variospora velana]
MLSPRNNEGGVLQGALPYNPLDYTVLSACTAIAWVFSIELILTITCTRNGRSGCYFWSLIISSAGCIVHALGFILKFLVGASWLIDLVFIGIGLQFHLKSHSSRLMLVAMHANLHVAGWVAMVSGQSFVLWSRLNLVVRNKRILNGVLAVITIDGFALHVPTLVFIWGANAPSPRWVDRFNTMERVQVLGFCFQEFAIGGIYIFATVKLLRALYYGDTRKAMLQLLAINCICVGMDVVLIALLFNGEYVAEASVKPLIYAIKLRLEFAVYSQLVGFTRAAFEDNKALDSPDSNADIQQAPRKYNSPADFFKIIPAVLKKPPSAPLIPTIHTHPEQVTKTDRAAGVGKMAEQWDLSQLNLSPNNAAAVFTANGDGMRPSIPGNLRFHAILNKGTTHFRSRDSDAGSESSAVHSEEYGVAVQ